MLVSSLVDLMRGVLDDDGPTPYWPSADLVQFLDAAQKFFVSLVPDDVISDLQTITQITLTAAAVGETVGFSNLPTNFFQFRLARIKSGTTFQTADLKRLEDIYAMERESEGRPTQSAPACSVWREQLAVYPTPTVDVANGIQLFYLTTVTSLTTVTDTPMVNENHHPILGEYALYLAWEKVNPDQAVTHLQNFGQYVQGMGGRWTDRALSQRARPRIAQDEQVQTT